ncbi:MAG TPA: S9 family peptidase [Bryobacteraceae bacterium]|nr:S9 family peptidase [Bryobacteraceae bacterium]
MKSIRPAIAGFVVLALSLLIHADTNVTPPVAKKVDHREVRHGATVVDNYFWLRDKSNPDVIDYLKSENAYTDALTKDLKPFEDALYKEMLGRIKQTDLSVPTRRGSYFYYSRTEEGKQYPIQCRKKGSMDAPEEVMLDGNELAKGHSFLGLGGLVVSDDENLLAYTTDTTGYRQYALHVKDLRTGETLPDTAERVTSLQWATDNKTLFLTTEDAVTKRSDRLWRHTLGDSKLEPIYEETDALYTIHVNRTLDKKFITVLANSTDTSEVRYLAANQPHGEFKIFLAREKKHRYIIGHREGLFYIRSNKNAKNFQVLTAPDSDPSPKNWKVFMAHQPAVLLDGIQLFKDFAVVSETTNALNNIRMYDFRSGKWSNIAFPEPVFAAFSSGNPEYDTHTFRYSYTSMISPQSVYDYDMDTHQSTLLKKQEVLGGYNPAQYTSERLWATARDGVKVPISIVYKKGFKRDGTAPLFLYAYGSYGIGTPPTFSSQRLSLLDRGMAFAIAHIRGGNEMGETWHDDGMLMKKKNTFFDFVDCAAFLVKDKWTSKEKLLIEGGSAGGLLMGAVVNLRPDLFRAVHAAVPFVDVMNTMLDASLPLTVGEYLEWGNPNEKAAYDYMKTYSPYDNLEKRAYPAMLVTTSLNDSQVGYWEPAKYVARLRALKTDSNPLLLKVNMGAGHGGSSGRYDRLKEQAFEYAWLLNQVGIKN